LQAVTRFICLGVAIGVLAYVALCAVMFIFQRSLLYFPQPRSDVTPQSTLNLAVEGAQLVVSVRPLDGSRALLYFGGNGEDVSQSLASLSRAFPDRALYLMHYRGYGGSSGAPTEAANQADAKVLFDQVARQHPEVLVIGRSLGSGVAVRLASERPVSRLILVTPYDSLLRIAAHRYPYLPVRCLLLDRYESWRYAPQVRAPTTILAAEHDEVIPRASTARLFARFAPGVATLHTLAGVGHNSIDTSADYLAILQGAPSSLSSARAP
jgi:hypothetical protein